MSSITRIIDKTRSLINDLEQSNLDSFIYVNSSIFTLGETANSITFVEINGVTTSSYSFNSSTNKITISASLTANDVVVIKYTYYAKYSDTEIKSYIDGALSHISINGIKNFMIESGLRFYPYPTESEENLIAIITAILMKPLFNSYRTATVSVSFPERQSKEEKIADIIGRFKHSSSSGLFFLSS